MKKEELIEEMEGALMVLKQHAGNMGIFILDEGNFIIRKTKEGWRTGDYFSEVISKMNEQGATHAVMIVALKAGEVCVPALSLVSKELLEDILLLFSFYKEIKSGVHNDTLSKVLHNPLAFSGNTMPSPDLLSVEDLVMIMAKTEEDSLLSFIKEVRSLTYSNMN